jgi:hypothetical protein
MACATQPLSRSTNNVARTNRSADNHQFRWTGQKEKAAVLVAEDRDTDAEIAEKVGCSPRQLYEWKRTAEFLERVQINVQDFVIRVRARGIARIEKRIEAKNERWQGLRRVIAERAADPDMQHVPGGTTGLIVHERKSIGFGKDSEIVDQYVVDTGLLRALNDLEKEAAQELGQWAEKHEHSGPDGGPIPIMALDLIINAADAKPVEIEPASKATSDHQQHG